MNTDSSGEQDIRLAYRTTKGCPKESTFAAGLRRLSPQLRIEQEPAAEFLRISFERRDDQFVGHLSFRETEREVTAGECADAAYALAVVAAITLDPEAKVEQSRVVADDFDDAIATPTNPVNSSEQTTAATGNAATAEAKPATAPKRILPKPVIAEPRVRPPAPELQGAPSQWHVLAGPTATWGEVGTWTLGASIDAMFTSRHSLASYILAIRGAATRRDLGVTTLEFTRLDAALGWCPRLVQSGAWRLHVCAEADLGWASVSTRDTSRYASSSDPGGLDASAALEGVLLIPLGSSWEIALRPGLVAPFIRNEYVLEARPGVSAQTIQHASFVGRGFLQVGYAFD